MLFFGESECQCEVDLGRNSFNQQHNVRVKFNLGLELRSAAQQCKGAVWYFGNGGLLMSLCQLVLNLSVLRCIGSHFSG